MKNILVTLPLEVDEKIQMQNAVSDSDESYQLIYLEDSSVDICDIQSASAIIGMIPPSLLGSACKSNLRNFLYHAVEWSIYRDPVRG